MDLLHSNIKLVFVVLITNGFVMTSVRGHLEVFYYDVRVRMFRGDGGNEVGLKISGKLASKIDGMRVVGSKDR